MTGLPPRNAKFSKILILILAEGYLIENTDNPNRDRHQHVAGSIEQIATIIIEILRPITPFDHGDQGEIVWRHLQTARANSYLKDPEIETDPDAWLAYAAQCIESLERHRPGRATLKIEACAALLNAILKPNIQSPVTNAGDTADGHEPDKLTHLHRSAAPPNAAS